MTNPNPFLPQGSLAEQKNQKRARLKTAVFSILGINFALVAGVLLIQGCGGGTDKKAENGTGSPMTNDNSTLVKDTSMTNTTSGLLPPDTAGTLAPSNTLAAAPSNTTTTMPLDNHVSTPTGAGSLTASPVSNTTTTTTLTPVNLTSAPVGPTTEYVVAKGDIISTIAKKVHVSGKAILAANPGVVPTKLKVGQKLQIPAPSVPTVATTTTTTPEAKDNTTVTAPTGTYVVKAHDTLTKIAHQNGTTVRAIKAENKLKTDAIRVGEKLKLPVKGAPVSSAAADTAPMTIPSAPILAASNVATPVSTTAAVTTH